MPLSIVPVNCTMAGDLKVTTQTNLRIIDETRQDYLFSQQNTRIHLTSELEFFLTNQKCNAIKGTRQIAHKIRNANFNDQ